MLVRISLSLKNTVCPQWVLDSIGERNTLRHMEEFSPIESEAKRGQSRYTKKYLA